MAATKAVAGKDVEKPGATPAPATSKPVIVGHTSQIADPMVSPVAESPAPTAAAAPAVSTPPAPTPTPSAGSSRPKLTPSTEATQAAQAEQDDKQTEDADKAEALAAEAEEKYQTRAQELIESGEYHVSIAQKNAKGNVRMFMTTLLLIVLIGVAVLYVLADLNVVDLGFKLPFELFK